MAIIASGQTTNGVGAFVVLGQDEDSTSGEYLIRVTGTPDGATFKVVAMAPNGTSPADEYENGDAAQGTVASGFVVNGLPRGEQVSVRASGGGASLSWDAELVAVA